MNKRNIASLLTILMFLLIAAQTIIAQDGSAREYLKAGNDAFKEGNYDRAIKLYEKLLEYYPKSSQANEAKKKLEDKKIKEYQAAKQAREQQEQKNEQERVAQEQQQREETARLRIAEQRRGTIRLYSPVDGIVLINGEESAFAAGANSIVNITVEDAPGKTFTLAVRDSKGTVFEAFRKVTFEEQQPASTDTGTGRRENPAHDFVFNFSPMTPEGVVVETNTPLGKFAAIRDPNPPVNSGNDFEIRQNNQGGITITKYTGSRRQVVIPETIEGIKVTEIGDGAFSNASNSPLFVQDDNYSASVSRISPIGRAVYTVFIPNTVTTIGGRAFKGQLLREVRFGNSVKTIGSEAFNDCWLSSITIPNSVTEIGVGAFGDNALTSVILGNGLVAIRAETFQNNNLTEISLPATLRTISYRAFQNNRISSLTIPRGVTSLGKDAFANGQPTLTKDASNVRPKFTTVSIPSSLTDFADAFGRGNTSITTITIGANVSANNLTQFGNGFSTFYESQGKKAGTYTWSGRIWTVK